MAVTIRPAEPADRHQLNAMLDSDPDPLWLAQGHRFHRFPGTTDPDPPAGSITMAAVEDGTVIGLGTARTNAVHPGRINTAIEVRPERRREGIGSALLRCLLDARHRLRAPRLPLSGKVRTGSGAAGFAAANGARVYQHCPAPVGDPRSAAMACWFADRDDADAGAVSSLDELPDRLVAQYFRELYLWVHEDWSPADVAALAAISDAAAAECDRRLSSLVRVGGRAAAVVFAFRTDTDLELVCETLRRDQPDGRRLLARGVARTLQVAAASGVTRVEFDGHTSDPHLAALLADIPLPERHPLDLVEIP
ncbi:GNAT family N-acetyltransferase [Nakamurella aerolata]|uniref:GNAT family N-acetyltransferase n=1 Tax=Nakamurella aerolata TaxID=1656892 RepID=A0A849AB41_9ACTN|nr:GNAT family N-acetyltransferase [Nakamurella aerolata]NNG35690.1 GNAT family N-acetyltransferase [Nakamurella aerolata]